MVFGKWNTAPHRWCPPLRHPTHPRDFLRFQARCKFKISQRVWRQAAVYTLYKGSAGSLPASILYTFLCHYHVPLSFLPLWLWSFSKRLDWSIIISLFSTDPECVAWPRTTTNCVVFRITHTAEGQHSCSWRTNWSMLGDRLPGHKNEGFHGEIFWAMKAISKRNRMNLQLWVHPFPNAVNSERTDLPTTFFYCNKEKNPLTLLIFCRLVAGSAASVL